MQNILPKAGEVLFFPSFFNKEESDRLFNSLLKNIVWKQESIRIMRKMINQPRMTALYGESGLPYKYSGVMMNPHPWTPELIEIKKKIETVAKVEFSTVLLNLYRDGKDSVAYHRDGTKELGINPVIGSVSFGATRTFKLRHVKDKQVMSLELPHGSYLLMRGETQHKWQHQIPKTSKPVRERINLTFRVVRLPV